MFDPGPSRKLNRHLKILLLGNLTSFVKTTSGEKNNLRENMVAENLFRRVAVLDSPEIVLSGVMSSQASF